MAVVRMTPQATEEFAAVPRGIRPRMIAIMAQLEQWPDVSGVKPLRGNLAGHYRKRTGDYRMPFKVEGDTVIVEKIGHRDGFYED